MGETLQDYELARQERLWDGVNLWLSARPQGGVYMLGYHAEMSLKLAYFRWQGLNVATVIDRARLDTAKAKGKVLGVTTPILGFHSLRFWRDLLEAERAAASRPLDPQLAADLHVYVNAIHARWSVEMRYGAPKSSMVDLEVVAAAVDWLDTNHSRLYT